MAVDDQKTSSFEKMPPPSLPLKAAKANPNATIALPSMEAFEEMARVASTPYHGRRTFDDDDEDEVDPNEYKSSSSSGGQSLMTTTQNAALTKSDKVLHEGAVVVTVTAAQEKDRREDVGEEVGAELHSPGMREEE